MEALKGNRGVALILISALGGVGELNPVPAVLPPAMTRYFF
jgi:hypothetical protein